MSVLRRLELDGANVSARLQGSTARLVIQSQPRISGPGRGIAPARAASDGDGDAPTGATGETGPEPEEDDEPEWLPQASLLDIETGERVTTPIAGCDDVSYPGRVLRAGPPLGAHHRPGERHRAHGRRLGLDRRHHGLRVDGSLYVATLKMTPPERRRRRLHRPPHRAGLGVIPASSPARPRSTASTPPASTRRITRRAARFPGASSASSPCRSPKACFASPRRRATRGPRGPGESESMITTLAESDGSSRSSAGRRPRTWRGDLRRPLHRRHGLRRDLRADRPALHRGPVRSRRPRDDGRAQDPRLLGLSPPGRRRQAAGHRPGRHAKAARSPAPRPRSSTSPTRRSRNGSTRWTSRTAARARPRPSGTTTRSSYSPEHSLAVVPVAELRARRPRRARSRSPVDPDSGLAEVAQLEDEGQIERTLIAGENLVTVSTHGVAVRPIAGSRPRSRSGRAPPARPGSRPRAPPRATRSRPRDARGPARAWSGSEASARAT